MSAELRIDKEFEALCPKLTEEELKLLTEQIEADGCRDAIVTWANHDDTIIDGFNRYKICRKRGLGFKTKALTFASRAEVINWIVKNQIGRRNLNETQRAALAARMVTTGGPGQPEKNSPNSANTSVSTAKAAEICNVGVTSVKDAKKVYEKGSPALQEAMKQGEVSVSSAATITELPKAEQTKAVKEGKVAEVAKEVKEAKKHNDDFDPAKLDKQKRPKNGSAVFKDEVVEPLFGKIVRLYDQRENSVGGKAAAYKKCRDTLDVALKAWKELTRA